IPTLKDTQHSFRNSDAFYHDPEKCEHAGSKVTTSHGGNTSQQGCSRDLLWLMILNKAQRSHKSKELCSKITTFRTKMVLEESKTTSQSQRSTHGMLGFELAFVTLPDPKLKTLGEKGIECIFVGYVEHSKAFRTRDEVSEQHYYCFNIKDDLKTFNEAMKSQDVAFLKEAINDEMDSIMGWATTHGCWKSGIDYFDTYALVACISTIRLLIALASIHSLIIQQMDVKIAFLNGELDEEVLNEDMGEADVILGIRIKHKSNEIAISQSYYIEKYSMVIGCLMYVMTCTRPDIAFVVGKLSRCAISWASKKKTCITSSTMEYEFVALAAAGKEVEWLKSLILEISLWSKPIAPISILCDSAATLAKTYSKMYNGKSRHLGVRYSMIRKLIVNEMVSKEFVRSQQNLGDHLTKGLSRDLVLKSAKGMGLKSNQVAEC
ncbi:zinc finger, CCHC-type containing protein, partial [Tanacetum coccineum]